MTRTPVVTPFRPPEPVAAVIPNGLVPPSCRPEVMTITPQIAQEWTTLNTRNRAVRYTKVAQYARDMKAGNWMLNGETVKIAAACPPRRRTRSTPGWPANSPTSSPCAAK